MTDTDVAMMTPRQNRMLFALLRVAAEEHEPRGQFDRRKWASDVLGREVESFRTLTLNEARTLIDELAPPVEEIPYEEEAF